MEPYNQETEAVMRRFYGSLSEKDRRRYAGIEALKYGHGGRNYRLSDKDSCSFYAAWSTLPSFSQ